MSKKVPNNRGMVSSTIYSRIKSNAKGPITVVGCFGTFIVILISIAFALGAVLWPYTINTWLIYSGDPPQLEWWMGGLMGLVPGIGQACIPAAFVTFVLMLFLGGTVV